MKKKDPVTAESCNYSVLGSFWDRFEIVLGSFWNSFGLILKKLKKTKIIPTETQKAAVRGSARKIEGSAPRAAGSRGP